MASSQHMIREGNVLNVWEVSAWRLAPLMLVYSDTSQQHHKRRYAIARPSWSLRRFLARRSRLSGGVLKSCYT